MTTPHQPRRVLVCGDRNWNDEHMIADFVEGLPPGSTVIEGCARGADTHAGTAAEYCNQELNRGLEHLMFPANWEWFGRAAGPIRNRQMLDEGKPTEVHAFHKDITSSKGTKNMLAQAKARGIPCYLHTHTGVEQY